MTREGLRELVQKFVLLKIPNNVSVVTDHYLATRMGLKNPRPIYTVILVCYAAGLLKQNATNKLRYKWWSEDSTDIFTPDSSWHGVSIEVTRVVGTGRSTAQLRIITQTIMKDIPQYMWDSYLTVQQISDLASVDRRRTYEVMSILTYMGIFIKNRKA